MKVPDIFRVFLRIAGPSRARSIKCPSIPGNSFTTLAANSRPVVPFYLYLDAPMATPLLAVVFDHDGTLVNSEPVHHRAWQHTLAPFAVSFDFATFETYCVGHPTAKAAQWICQTYQLPVTAAELLANKQAQLDGFLRQEPFPLMPGALELLQTCRDLGLRTAIASGAAAHEIQRTLDGHSLAGFFDAIACKDHVARNKPAPDVYELALQRLDVSAAKAVAVEDSDTGQASARAAQLRVLRLNHPSQTDEQVTRVPDLAAVAGWIRAQLEGEISQQRE